MAGFAFHPEALRDLDEVWDFIARDDPYAAGRTVDKILAAIEKAVAFPQSGHRRPDLSPRPLRFLVVFEYLIAYAPEEKPLWVIAVMHGNRSPRIMASILSGREHEVV